MEEDFAGRHARREHLHAPPLSRGSATTSREEEWREWQRRPRVYHSDVAIIRDALPAGHALRRRESGQPHARPRTYARPRQVEAHAVEGDYFTIKKLRPRPTAASSRRRKHELGAPVVVIGDEVAKYFFPDLNPIGRELRIGGIPYTVIGVIEHQGSLFGQSLDKLGDRAVQLARCTA